MDRDQKKGSVVFVDLEEYKRERTPGEGNVPQPEEKVEEQEAHASETSNGKKEQEKIQLQPAAEEKKSEEKKCAEYKKAPSSPDETKLEKEPVPDMNARDDTEKKKIAYSILGAAAAVFLIVGAVMLYGRIKEEEYRKEKNSAFAEAKAEMEINAYDETVSLLKELIEKYPEDSRGYEYLGTLYFNTEEYDKTIEILEEGWVYADDTEYTEYSQLYADAETRSLYYEIIDLARQYAGDGMADESKGEYLAAIEIEDSLDDAYYGLTDLYISQEQYDEALEWLDTVSCEGEFTYEVKSELEQRCRQEKQNKIIGSLYAKMQKKEYKGLMELFESASDELDLLADIYYQDGNATDTITEGSGVIVNSYGIYAGEIKNSERSGKGIQFVAFAEEYIVMDGQWSGDKVNGQCTYSYVNTEDNTENVIYKGNVKDNLFHGDISLKMYRSDGKQDTFYIHAENGTYDCIRIQDGKYVYGESNSNWYVYYDSEEGLKNHGVWTLY